MHDDKAAKAFEKLLADMGACAKKMFDKGYVPAVMIGWNIQEDAVIARPLDSGLSADAVKGLVVRVVAGEIDPTALG